jgi:AraC family transcriptional regulator
MITTNLHESAALSVIEYRCTAAASDPSFVEQHVRSSLSYVYAGSFGCHVGKTRHELVSGAVLVGRAGDDYRCTHEHHSGGDVCLSIQLGADLSELTAMRTHELASGSVPPTAELMMLGELVRAAARGTSDLGVDEAALWFSARYAALQGALPPRAARLSAQDRKRALSAAEWIESHACEPIALADVAREAQLTPFHFLRLYSRVLGVSPHQYLVRTRLRLAARLLAEPDASVTDTAYAVGFGDLSNFIRTFTRAAGVSPRMFRQAARGDRKLVHDRLAARN